MQAAEVDPEHMQTNGRVSDTMDARGEDKAVQCCERFVVFKNDSTHFACQQPK